MKKYCSSKGFTIIELMVSIFITMTIIASFYKLYDASVKTERSSSIRVAVNLMGEQILDTVSESLRLIGLNSVKEDFTGVNNEGKSLIIHEAGEQKLEYLSPFGSPITKVKGCSGGDEGADCGTYPTCTFLLFNSAAFYSGVDKLYFHNQDGFFKTSSVSLNDYSENGVKVTATFASSDNDGTSCRDFFPVGSLVTGEDFVFTLEYGSSSDANALQLSYVKESNSSVGGTLINFSYDPNNENNYYSMPKFVLEYLVETCDGAGTCVTNWITPKGGAVLSDSQVKSIIAVRFGFVLLSRKERVYRGEETPSGLPKYCIFNDTNTTDDYYCYTLPSLNYTASVFRRVVYLSNYRFLKDQAGN